MTPVRRLRLGSRVLRRYLKVRLLLAMGRPLPVIVSRMSHRKAARDKRFRPSQLVRAVDRILKLPGRPLKCLPRALVLYSLLVDEGHDPRLAIGLPEDSPGVQAHAWVELGGRDIGPSPGRNGHSPMVIYPLAGRSRRDLFIGRGGETKTAMAEGGNSRRRSLRREADDHGA